VPSVAGLARDMVKQLDGPGKCWHQIQVGKNLSLIFHLQHFARDDHWHVGRALQAVRRSTWCLSLRTLQGSSGAEIKREYSGGKVVVEFLRKWWITSFVFSRQIPCCLGGVQNVENVI
jgi:hypothetical protein